MCGIACVLDDGPRADVLLDALGHRGPDSRGSADLGRCTMAMTRLAILDPDHRADQPMSHGGATIVFNGEIYNYPELRQELRSCGWTFTTTGDTEVLLKALVQWGEGAMAKLRGMYAFLLWREDRQELWAARDPYGIKPLYWAATPEGGVCFASEATALTEITGRRLSSVGIAEYLHFGSPYSTSAYAGVHEAPPGALMRWRPDGTVDVGEAGSPPHTHDENGCMAASVTEVVDRHLLSDRPVVVFLSGGFDSALVASRMTQRGAAAMVIDTGLNADDVAGARRTAAHYGLELRHVRCTVDDARLGIARYLASMDQPTIDGFNTFLISDAANAAGFPVALSGLGGDELLGGYGYYRRLDAAARAGAIYRHLPRVVQRRAAAAAASRTGHVASQVGAILAARSDVQRYFAWRSVFTVEEVERLTGTRPGLPEPVADDLDRSRNMELQALDFSEYLRATLLRDADVFSMACGVEVRVPLLDGDLVARVRERLPDAGKSDLAASVGDRHLQRLATQPKRTFGLPWRHWIAALDPAEVFADSDPWRGCVDVREARRLAGGAEPGGERHRALLVLAHWLAARDRPRRLVGRPV